MRCSTFGAHVAQKARPFSGRENDDDTVKSCEDPVSGIDFVPRKWARFGKGWAQKLCPVILMFWARPSVGSLLFMLHNNRSQCDAFPVGL